MIRSIRYLGVNINSGLMQIHNHLIRSLDSTQNHTTKIKIVDRRRGKPQGEEKRGDG